jgi:hypothetical protein
MTIVRVLMPDGSEERCLGPFATEEDANRWVRNFGSLTCPGATFTIARVWQPPVPPPSGPFRATNRTREL